MAVMLSFAFVYPVINPWLNQIHYRNVQYAVKVIHFVHHVQGLHILHAPVINGKNGSKKSVKRLKMLTQNPVMI